MDRPLRLVYPGAVYHVIARGDGGKAIFVEKGSKLLQRKGSHAPAAVKKHGECEAEKIVVWGMAQLGVVG